MPTMATAVSIRELPPEEWSRLLAFEPFTTGGLPQPEHWRVVVGESEGRIIAFTCLYTAVHFEPIWLDPAYRHQPGLFAGLWAESKRILEDHSVTLLFAVVPDLLPQQQRMVEKFGFTRAPGQLYLGVVDSIGV